MAIRVIFETEFLYYYFCHVVRHYHTHVLIKIVAFIGSHEWQAVFAEPSWPARKYISECSKPEVEYEERDKDNKIEVAKLKIQYVGSVGLQAPKTLE